MTDPLSLFDELPPGAGAVAAPPGRVWTDAQGAAIAARARTLVAAAAGSGKTSVLTELVAQVLVAREVAPEEICAVTFTERAAQEMRERIAARLESLGERDLLAELERARIGTIHSLCASVLRSHGTAVGVDPEAGVLDEAQSTWILREAARHSIDALATDLDVHWLRARMGDERLEVSLRGIHRCAMQGDGTATLPPADSVLVPTDRKTGEPVIPLAEVRRAMVAIDRLWQQFHQEVEARSRTLGRISFDDLERYAVDAVRLPAVRTALRARWTMVLVDEFQDTNPRQYELLDTIGGERLFMVGDEWQSIYRFRGADVGVFRERRNDPDNHVLPMRENFRSGAPVLDVVNRIFAHETSFGDGYEPVIPGTEEQRAQAAPAVELLVVPENEVEGEHPELVGVSRRDREARRVAERIAQLVESGTAEPGDIAVLYARGTGVDLYEQAIAAWGIPVLCAASSGFYDQRDVRDALAVLGALRNGADDFAMLSVLAGPIGRLEWSELAELTRAAHDARRPLGALVAESQLPGALHVCAVLADLRRASQRASLVELVARVVAIPELELGAALELDGEIRVANLRRLMELAASAEGVGVRGVAGLLEFVDAQRRDARVGEASIADETTGAVRLMTIHASKGLEFEHVFVIEAGAKAGGRSDLVPEARLDADEVVHVGVPRADGRCERTIVLDELHQTDKAAQAEESLRLWYVAMTRARTALYLSAAWNFEPTKAGKPRSLNPTLGWLVAAMELPDDLGGVRRRVPALDGLATLDTHGATLEPRRAWHADDTRRVLAAPLPLPDAAPGTRADAAAEDQEPHALRETLRDAIVAAHADDWRQLQGTRVHDAVARLLDAARGGTPLDRLLDPEHGPWLTDAVRARLVDVVAAPAFQRLAALGARTEVAYVSGSGSTVASRAVPGLDIAADVAAVDDGRIDALAQLEGGDPWIVDWKTTLPDTAAAAWHEHGRQLGRYARALHNTGAVTAVVTLVSLNDPAVAWSWRIDAGIDTPTEIPLPA